jgi:hypothetical protein
MMTSILSKSHTLQACLRPGYWLGLLVMAVVLGMAPAGSSARPAHAAESSVNFQVQRDETQRAVILSWDSPSSPANFQASRSNVPYFNHGDAGVIDIASLCVENGGRVTCTDEDATGNYFDNHYYLISIYDASGQLVEEQRVGEFDFSTNDSATMAIRSDIVIDHTSIEEFDAIPDEYIQKASQLTMLFRHASVGSNINDGLDCLMNNFDVRPDHCDRGLSPDEIVYDPKYDRTLWFFEPHNDENPNPGWWNKENYFIDRVNGLGNGEDYEVVGFKFGYVDGENGSNIDDKFFNNDPNDNYPSNEDLEQLEDDHPDKLVLWMTMALARAIGTPDSASFNQQMRDYAILRHKVFLDIADIESHAPDGTPCYDNAGNGIEAICPDYTEETNGGHLNARGKQRVAKAIWVMMAKVAGWEGTR